MIVRYFLEVFGLFARRPKSSSNSSDGMVSTSSTTSAPYRRSNEDIAQPLELDSGSGSSDFGGRGVAAGSTHSPLGAAGVARQTRLLAACGVLCRKSIRTPRERVPDEVVWTASCASRASAPRPKHFPTQPLRERNNHTSTGKLPRHIFKLTSDGLIVQLNRPRRHLEVLSPNFDPLIEP